MPQNQGWRDDALCSKTNFLEGKDSEDFDSTKDYQTENIRAAHKMFFPERGDNASKDVAVDICQNCPVKIECLAYSLNTGPKSGIWGGISGRDRRRVRRMRNQVKLSSTGFRKDYFEHNDEFSSWWHDESEVDFQKMLDMELVKLAPGEEADDPETELDESLEPVEPFDFDELEDQDEGSDE